MTKEINGALCRVINETRFKTAVMSLTLTCPLSGDDAAANALLPNLLVRACAKYPDFTALRKKLAMLYGASLSADVLSLGDAQLLRMSIYALDDRFTMNGERISGECVQLLCDILTCPPLENGLFTLSDLEAEKIQLCDLIDSQTNDKIKYAARRCIDLMCEGEPFGINPLGGKEAVEALTPEDMTNVWKRALESYPITLTAVGSMDADGVFSAFSEAVSGIKRSPMPLPNQLVKASADSVREFTEREEVAQSKLVLGFRSPYSTLDDISIMKMTCACFGGTPYSRLFVNVREKLSLCYYCSTRYYSPKGIVLVQSGLESQNIEKARDEIFAQLDDIRAGNLTDTEIEHARLALRNGYIASRDSAAATESWYISQMFSGQCLSTEEACAALDRVTKDDITKAARALSFDSAYLLTGKEN